MRVKRINPFKPVGTPVARNEHSVSMLFFLMTVSLTSHPGTPAVSAQVFLQTHCVNITIVRVCETTDRILGISVTRHLGSLPRESTEFPSVKVIQSAP